jgi:hypothetical protein
MEITSSNELTTTGTNTKDHAEILESIYESFTHLITLYLTLLDSTASFTAARAVDQID